VSDLSFLLFVLFGGAPMFYYRRIPSATRARRVMLFPLRGRFAESPAARWLVELLVG